MEISLLLLIGVAAGSFMLGCFLGVVLMAALAMSARMAEETPSPFLPELPPVAEHEAPSLTRLAV